MSQYKISTHEFFESQGFHYCPKLISDPENYYSKPPRYPSGEPYTGYMKWIRPDKIEWDTEEEQVSGSLSRYRNPQYKKLYKDVRLKIEKILGLELFPTYYYERFYYVGQELTTHTDRPGCEISVTLQISTNSDKLWPLWFETPTNRKAHIDMQDGDAVIYKGCERPHWRFPLQSRFNNVERKWNQVRKISDDTYHHQIFMHYVNSQGPNVQYAYDTVR